MLVAESGAVTLSGELDDNSAAGNGGGACAVGDAALTLLDGAALRGNTAAGHGGGVYVSGVGAVLGAGLPPTVAISPPPPPPNSSSIYDLMHPAGPHGMTKC